MIKPFFQRLYVIVLCPLLLSLPTKPMLEKYHGKRYANERREYLRDESQRKIYEVDIRDGIFYKSDGSIFSTPDGTHAIFVVAASGKFYATTEHEHELFHHSNFVAGEPILVAGEMTFDEDGRLKTISYRSGHYRPGPYRLRLMLDILQNQFQVDLSKVVVKLPGLQMSDRALPEWTPSVELFRRVVTGTGFEADDLMLAMLADPKSDSHEAVNRIYYLLYHAQEEKGARLPYPKKFEPVLFDALKRLVRNPPTQEFLIYLIHNSETRHSPYARESAAFDETLKQLGAEVPKLAPQLKEILEARRIRGLSH